MRLNKMKRKQQTEKKLEIQRVHSLHIIRQTRTALNLFVWLLLHRSKNDNSIFTFVHTGKSTAFIFSCKHHHRDKIPENYENTKQQGKAG